MSVVIGFWFHAEDGIRDAHEGLEFRRVLFRSDMIKFVKPVVRVVGTGWVASAGALIYAAAQRENRFALPNTRRSEEHTSELQSLMRISYAVFCLKKKKKKHYIRTSKKHNTIKQKTHHNNYKSRQ